MSNPEEKRDPEQDRIDDEVLTLVTLVELVHPGFGQLLRDQDRDHVRCFDMDGRIALLVVSPVAVGDVAAPALEIVAGTFFEREGEDLIVIEPTPETATYTARRIRPNRTYSDWTYEDPDLAKAANAEFN